MAPSSRDRISVDLRGMKTALVARARAKGVTPSEFIRAALADASQPVSDVSTSAMNPSGASHARVRLSLRMPRDEAHLVLSKAKASGLSVGRYVAGLCAGIPALTNGSHPVELSMALVTSCAELSTLARDLRHLTLLLRQGEVRAAQQYRGRLDHTERDVRAHLAVAAAAMAQLRPIRATTARSGREHAKE
jgi:hypothetical protein